MSNKKNNDHAAAGWCIGTKENGAWYWNMSDGKTSYNYEPTSKQAINDGKWHQLTLSFDRKKQEIWMFFDGHNVAIYNIQDLKSLDSELRTVIGGTDEYQDWDSRGEWTAFNGKIDEVRVWDRSLTTKEVQENYNTFVAGTSKPKTAPDKLKIQVWNIWHGGHRFGQHVGLERTIDVLKKENADIIGLVETYGSGAIIADSLSYYFYLISSNLSIMSRYPIEETINVFRPFNSGGAIIDLGHNRKVAFFDIWLHYLPDMCDLRHGQKAVKVFLKEEEKTRLSEIKSILSEIQQRTDAADDIPVIMVGDFNCDSHVDWAEAHKAMHHGVVADLPVSRQMETAKFKDSFRELHPNVLQYPGITWSPLLNPTATESVCTPSRIDFIYYKGTKLIPFRSETLNHHPVFWPSDHGSVVTSFWIENPEK